LLSKGKFGLHFVWLPILGSIYKHYNFFPLFGGFGQRSRDLVLAFRHSFYHNLNPLELNTSRFVQKVNQSKEFDCFCDEMRDDIDEAI
jgi:hypothetical protein